MPTNAPANGWFVEVETTDGAVHTPDILDDPQRMPKTNDFPEIQIPVRKNEKWLNPEFEHAALRVWCDGKRQPIDQLEKVEVQEAQTILRGRGAIELKEPVEVQYDQIPIHEAARQLIEEHTTYTANVDEPETEVDQAVEVANTTTTEDFLNEFEVRETDPIDIRDGFIGPHQTCYVYDAVDDNNVTSFTDVNNQTWFSGGKVLSFTEQRDQVIFGAIRFGYRVPAENVGIKVRDQTVGSSDIRFLWNGFEFDRNQESDTPLEWKEIGNGSYYSESRGYQTQIGQDIEPNTNYWFKIIAEDASDYRLDSVAVYDNRYSYTWDNFNGNDGSYLAGPEEYPKRLWVSSRELPQTNAIIGASLEATFTTTDSIEDNLPSIGFSHNQGDYYLTSNSTNPELSGPWDDLDPPGGSLKVALVFSRWGNIPDRNRIPTKGFDPHRVTDYRLTADLSTLPIIVNRGYNESLRDVLRDLANRGNFIWEYRRDPQTGEQSIEWTQIGQREVDVDVDEVSYTVEKDSSQIVEQTSVYGSSQSYIARIQAKTGESVNLPHEHLQERGETVRNPRTGERYEYNEDYKIDYENGAITATNGGLMQNNGWYEVEYTYQTYGEYTLPGVSDPVELPPQDISGLASDTACSQAARTLIEELQTPQFEAEISIPQETVRWNLADALNIEGLETNGQALKQRSIEHRPGETVITLGIGRGVGEVIRDIETRVSSVSRNS